MKTAVALLLTTVLAAAQNGPPPGFFGDAPNTGGTLYLTYCTAAGWPCHDFRQEVWGQICHQTFADSWAKDHGGNVVYTKYSGWKCPGFVASARAKECFGFSDGGPANLPAEEHPDRWEFLKKCYASN